MPRNISAGEWPAHMGAYERIAPSPLARKIAALGSSFPVF
jgi:hypothetical protein